MSSDPVAGRCWACGMRFSEPPGPSCVDKPAHGLSGHVPRGTPTVRDEAAELIDRSLRLVGDRRARISALTRLLLAEIDDDPARAGLVDTPRRVADMWVDFCEHDAGTTNTVFEHTSDQMVMVGGVKVWSFCEHHLLPFYCDLAIAYIANAHVIGLSKLARIAQKHAHRLNMQETLVERIAEEVARVTSSPDVAVMGIGEHLCMTMRGARAPGLMLSTKLTGVFRDASVKAEFYQLARLAGMAHEPAR